MNCDDAAGGLKQGTLRRKQQMKYPGFAGVSLYPCLFLLQEVPGVHFAVLVTQHFKMQVRTG